MPLTALPRTRAARHRTATGRHVASRAGMTLPEVLIAGLITAALASALMGVLISQVRTFAKTAGAAAVQRDLHMGIALLPMDLRAASREGGDLVVLGPTELQMQATVGVSIVCDPVGVGLAGVVLPPLGHPQATFTAFVATPQQGDQVRVLTRDQLGGIGDRWISATVGPGGAQSPVPGAVTPRCTGGTFGSTATAPEAAFPRVYLPLVWAAGTTATDLSRVVTGMPVRILRLVRYRLYAAASGRWYLGYAERTPGGGWTAEEPIAGPYETATASAGAGIGFAYFDTLGVRLAAPVAATSVGRIDLTIRPRTQVRVGAGADSVVVRDSALVRVALRNRI